MGGGLGHEFVVPSWKKHSIHLHPPLFFSKTKFFSSSHESMLCYPIVKKAGPFGRAPRPAPVPHQAHVRHRRTWQHRGISAQCEKATRWAASLLLRQGGQVRMGAALRPVCRSAGHAYFCSLLFLKNKIFFLFFHSRLDTVIPSSQEICPFGKPGFLLDLLRTKTALPETHLPLPTFSYPVRKWCLAHKYSRGCCLGRSCSLFCL